MREVKWSKKPPHQYFNGDNSNNSTQSCKLLSYKNKVTMYIRFLPLYLGEIIRAVTSADLRVKQSADKQVSFRKPAL